MININGEYLNGLSLYEIDVLIKYYRIKLLGNNSIINSEESIKKCNYRYRNNLVGYVIIERCNSENIAINEIIKKLESVRMDKIMEMVQKLSDDSKDSKQVITNPLDTVVTTSIPTQERFSRTKKR